MHELGHKSRERGVGTQERGRQERSGLREDDIERAIFTVNATAASKKGVVGEREIKCDIRPQQRDKASTDRATQYPPSFGGTERICGN